MKPSALLLIALSATGCAQSTDKYPSLALRPIETRSEAEPVAPVVKETPDAALDARITASTAKLAQIDADFTTLAAKADAAARAKGAMATGSDQWLAAQEALAELEGLHGDTQGMVSDLEQMVTDRGIAGQPPYPTLDALHARARDQLNREIAKVAAVKALLGEK